jgi:hypothetical protein
MIIIKVAASTFPRAYSWVIDPSLIFHSISPKNLSDGEHKEHLQRPEKQHKQPSQLIVYVAHHQPEPIDADSAANSPAHVT